MDMVKDILWTLLLAGGIVLVIVTITLLIRVKKSIDQLLHEIHLIGQSTQPLVEKLEVAAEKANETLALINENGDTISEATEFLRRTAENIYRLENTLQVQIEPSVNAIARHIMGVRRGVDTFFEVLKRRR